MQMIDKITTNKPKKHRVITAIPASEARVWCKHFDLYGTQQELHRMKGVSSQTLRRILNAKKGDKTIVESIRSYMEMQQGA